jgi:hypothetical protein
MKKFILFALVLIGTAAFSTAGPVQTAIVTSGTPLRILNFVGGSTGALGNANVTINSVSTSARTSVPILDQEVQTVTNIAGPATLTVYAPGSDNVVISYKLDSNR